MEEISDLTDAGSFSLESGGRKKLVKDLVRLAEEGDNSLPLGTQLVRWVHSLRLEEPGTVNFVRPRRTLAVSVTGTRCEMNCAHCGGHFLRSMHDESWLQKGKWQTGKFAGSSSLLISGGCNSCFQVPWRRYFPELKRLTAAGYRLNMHVGLVEEADIDYLRELNATVSFDFIIHEQTLARVISPRIKPEQILHSYRLLRRGGVKVIPHICIGLLGGTVTGEWEALDLLAETGADAVTLIIFTPVPETAFAGHSPPPVADVAELFAAARTRLPDTELALGCLRPGSGYRQIVDLLALLLGFDRIVMPAPIAVRAAEQWKKGIKWTEECCSLA